MKNEKSVKARSVKDWKKSAKHGSAEWVSERLTAFILIPMTIWAVSSGIDLAGTGFDGARAFVLVPMNAGLMGVFVLVCVWHMYMGLKAVIDDYIGKPSTRGLLVFLNFVLSASILIGSIGALYLVKLGA